MGRLWVAAVLAPLLAGCGGVPDEVRFQVRAAPRINPDPDGSPMPTLLRLYVLSSPTRFRNADYFALAGREREVLDGDLLLRRELMVRPGDSQDISLSIPPDTRSVGVAAGFRDLDRSNWMAVRPVPGNGRVPVLVREREVSLPDRLPPAEPVVARLPTLPDFQPLPSLPSMPSLPSVPALPSAPSLPSLPSMPSVPGF